MKKFILFINIILLICKTLFAQDPHFTQYFASPLTLNPAMTGIMPGDYRFASNYREQWASVSSHPYVTGTFSYDMSMLKNKLGSGDGLGIGLLGLYDKSGLGGLQNTTVGVSLAYHKAFGSDKQHAISLGVQGDMVQKSINFSALKFDDQFNIATGGTAYSTTESFSNASMSYLDYNGGIMYTGIIRENTTLYAGASVYHITEPIETFMGGDHKIYARYSGYLGSVFNLNERLLLYISGLYQNQGPATEVLAGASLGFILNDSYEPQSLANTILHIGGWYRSVDCISPYISLEWSGFQVGISYDENISEFEPATNGYGAYEITLIYNGARSTINKATYQLGCPRF